MATRTVLVGTCPECAQRLICYRKRTTGVPTVGLHYVNPYDAKPCRGRGQYAYAPAVVVEERA